MKKLEGKVAIVTGGATGIGKAACEMFALEGARVVLADVNAQIGMKTVREIEKAGGEATFVQVDVRKLDEIGRMFKTAIDNYGGLNILFSNAGVPGVPGIEEVTEADFDNTVAVNLKAAFFAAQQAVPIMKKAGGGCIIFTSSAAGVSGGARSPSYSATKGGLIALAKSLALALAKDNIRVNAICPGPIDTAMLGGVTANGGNVSTSSYLGRVAMRRLGKPEEAAYAALFLASDEASYITGVALSVDGGQTCG